LCAFDLYIQIVRTPEFAACRPHCRILNPADTFIKQRQLWLDAVNLPPKYVLGYYSDPLKDLLSFIAALRKFSSFIEINPNLSLLIKTYGNSTALIPLLLEHMTDYSRARTTIAFRDCFLVEDVLRCQTENLLSSLRLGFSTLFFLPADSSAAAQRIQLLTPVLLSQDPKLIKSRFTLAFHPSLNILATMRQYSSLSPVLEPLKRLLHFFTCHRSKQSEQFFYPKGLLLRFRRLCLPYSKC